MKKTLILIIMVILAFIFTSLTVKTEVFVVNKPQKPGVQRVLDQNSDENSQKMVKSVEK